MPSTEREGSTDRELVLKHQHSFADSVSSRASIPMWDSADPDRAPPPLPLNPTSASPTRPNTSATIASAAAALTEKARENASPYTSNPLPPKRETSPDKSLIRGHHHKRMQSLQTGTSSVRDLSSYLENSGTRSPERSLVLSSTPGSRDRKKESPEHSPTRTPTRAYSPTPFSKDPTKELPAMRPTTRPPPRSILGENTPPTSATMLAIQNMATPSSIEVPLSTITNNSTAVTRTPQTFDAISSQILSLTSIATNLQREMAQLSRRSKDNATDLISLKEATNTRDEDIRKSLKELLSSLSTAARNKNESESRGATGTTRSQSTPTGATGGFLIDNKPHCDPASSRAFLPRIPSPNSFAASLERELTGSPSPYHMDGAANLALLEKILREMATKEGQQRMSSSLEELSAKGGNGGSEATKKLEEVLQLLKEKSGQVTLFSPPGKDQSQPGGNRRQSHVEFDTPRSGPLARTARDVTPHPNEANNGRTAYSSPRAADFIGDEILKLLRKMKDSVTENGGMTSEIKALVRELRGEVLGMGREIGRKLDTEQGKSKSGPSKLELAKIIEDGLGELKDHMDRIVKDKRRQSSSSTLSRSTVDSQEVYQAVKHALGETQMFRANAGAGLSKEEILDAIKDAWESYRPEIELQNFGLERDEILQCLKEGLDQYRPNKDEGEISRVEILEAIQEGLQKFKAPAPETEASLTRDELLLTVRECLENFDFPSGSNSGSRGFDTELAHGTVLDAVREALSTHDFGHHAKPADISHDLVASTIKEAIRDQGSSIDGGEGLGEEVMSQLNIILDEMRNQFQGVSDEAKQNVAANGRDTEQVLDAIKDGHERLRAEIEIYVDRAADVTGRDEIIDAIKSSTDEIAARMESARSALSSESGSGSGDLQSVKEELEHLRSILAANLVKNNRSVSDDLVDTIRDEFEHLRSCLPREGEAQVSNETIVVMKEEFEQLRSHIAGTLVMPSTGTQREEIVEAVRECMEGLRADLEGVHPKGRPESVFSNTSELLDAFNDGIDSLKADVEKLSKKTEQPNVSEEILETLKDGLASVRADLDALKERPSTSSSRELAPNDGEIVTADSLKRDDIENLEILMTQLRIKVESLDGMPQPGQTAPNDPDVGVSREHFAAVEQVIREVQASVAELGSKDREADGSGVNREDMDAIETLLINTKAKIDDVLVPAAELSAQKQHVEYLETMVKDTKDSLEDLTVKISSDSQRKEDFVLLESLIKEIQISVEDMKERAAQDYESGERPTKTDLDAIETVCVDTKSHIEQLIIPHLESLPTKTDISQVQEIIIGHKETSGRDAVEMIRMMEDRKMDHEVLTKDVASFKALLEDLKEELKTRIEDGAQGIDDLGRLMDNLGETVTSNSGASADIKELIETVQREAERTHGSIESIKLDADDQTATVVQKQEERNAELLAKLDDRFDELMTKYDDAQLDAKDKTDAFDDSRAANEELLAGTRTVLEEVKLNTTTLGTTMTDLTDRLGEDSKVVFNRVEDTYAKLDQFHGGSQAAHQSTHEYQQKAQSSLDTIHNQVHEYQPKIFNSVKDILLIVGQHFEQSRQRATKEQEELEASAQRSAPAIEPAPLGPPAPTVQQILEREKYDDSELHDKLDRVLSHFSDSTPQTAAQMALLDQIHAQVSLTSSEMSQFVAAQAKLITADHETKEKQAAEAALLLENRLAQKTALEAELTAMAAQRDSLSSDLEVLRTDVVELSATKSRCAADLASLETALKIRREEVTLMESRAEAVERRILDGLIDQSRSLMSGRSGPGSMISSSVVSAPMAGDSMALKRVSSRTASGGSVAASALGSTVSRSTNGARIQGPPQGLSALKRSAVKAKLRNAAIGPDSKAVPTISRSAASPAGAKGATGPTGNSARRILSLSQITHNVPHGGNAAAVSGGGLGIGNVSINAPYNTTSATNGAKGLSRSQSVRTATATGVGRKASWNTKFFGGAGAKGGKAGRKSLSPPGVDEKENDDQGRDGSSDAEDDSLSIGTTRRSSIGLLTAGATAGDMNQLVRKASLMDGASVAEESESDEGVERSRTSMASSGGDESGEEFEEASELDDVSMSAGGWSESVVGTVDGH